jgi:hypothetical protein
MLPDADSKRKSELRAMYDNLVPTQARMLRAIRAQRGIDAVDVFHAVLRDQWGNMTEREKALWLRISPLATQLASKLKGQARFK